MHIQATGSTCNVTVFDITALYTAVTNPTKPCEQSIYNKTCTVFQGSLLIDISPAIDGNGNFLQQKDPKIQVSACLHSEWLQNSFEAWVVWVAAFPAQYMQIAALTVDIW